CGISAIEDAKKVCQKLNIKHYVLNFNKVLEEKVIKNFCSEYLKGKTPNPCVQCNRYLKFGKLLEKAKSLGAKYLATGHYAKIGFDKASKKFQLKKAKDRHKDQTYFLFYLNQNRLKNILMPLGDLTKLEVRQIAKEQNLPVADKPGSQEICFLPTDSYQEFLKNRYPEKIKPGKIVDKNNNVLGLHKGVSYYTIGQRQGLGIAWSEPLYITSIDAKNNIICVGNKKELFSKGLIAKQLNFISNINLDKKFLEAKVKIRYNHKEVSARIIGLGNKNCKVNFSEPVPAVTQGQAVVFYKEDIVLGGGIIERAIK
ncbi:MAG: tRNA 2-thiouridine(34) synthase MnmA, partial [Candidatus Omnitrophota bacterium]